MKKKKYLPLYYKWIKEGKLPGYGLCFSFGDLDGQYVRQHDPISIFEPLNDEEYSPLKEYKLWQCFWAADGETNGRHLMGKFTPLRQNIVLLMAAMNGEL
jgi:hypothetical protein